MTATWFRCATDCYCKSGKGLRRTETAGLGNTPGLIIVECFGTPGTGKTFVASKLLSELERTGKEVSDQGIRVTNAPMLPRLANKSIIILRALVKSPALLVQTTRLVRLHGVPYSIQLLRLVGNWLYVISLIRANFGQSHTLILDQGLGQALWSTMFHGSVAPDPKVVIKQMNALLSRSAIGRLVVFHIAADHDVVLTRILSREGGSSPLDRDPRLFQRANAITGSSLKILAALATKSDRVDIFEYRNDDGADVAAIIGVLDAADC